MSSSNNRHMEDKARKADSSLGFSVYIWLLNIDPIGQSVAESKKNTSLLPAGWFVVAVLTREFCARRLRLRCFVEGFA